MREAIIFIADTHINSKVALIAPDIVDDDGDTHQPNLIQQWLWNTWNKCTKEINTLAKGYYKTVIFNGDVVDLDAKNRSNQMVSKNPATIMKMADKTLEPILDIADRLFFVRGTEAHVGRSGWIEEMLAEKYGAVPDAGTQQNSWWHLRAEFSGVRFDVAHHTSLGTLDWTYPNMITRLVQQTRLRYLDWDEPQPHVVVRAHRHRHVDTGTTLSTRGVCLPCWQYYTSYLYRINAENTQPHIGACVFLCNKGEYTYHPLLYEPKRSPAWTRMETSKN